MGLNAGGFKNNVKWYLMNNLILYYFVGFVQLLELSVQEIKWAAIKYI